MKHTILIILMLLPTLAFASHHQRVSLDVNGITVGSLMQSEIHDDCGCAFYTPVNKKDKGAEILQWVDEDDGSAHMFIDNHLVNLDLEDSIPLVSQLHQKASFMLKGDNLKVTGKLSSSYICPVTAESCEETDFTGTLHVKKGNKSASIPVWGSCGC